MIIHKILIKRCFNIFKEYFEQIKKTCGQIGLNAQSIMEQDKHVKMLETNLKEKSHQISTLEKQKQDLIDDLNNLKISNDYDLNELKKEALTTFFS